jgi:hypothetical protein
MHQMYPTPEPNAFDLVESRLADKLCDEHIRANIGEAKRYANYEPETEEDEADGE